MKRDNDLIRSLLLEIEAHDDAIFLCVLTDGSPDDERRSYYHLKLLVDAGMLEERGKFGGSFRMTNYGHDFIEAIRSESIWNDVKGVVATVGGATLGIMADIAKTCITAEINKHLGVGS